MSTYLDMIFAGGRALDGGIGWPSPASVAQSLLPPELRPATAEDRFYAETVYPTQITVSSGPSDVVTNVIGSNAVVTGEYTARLASYGSPGSVTFSFRYSPDVIVNIVASTLLRTRIGWAAGSLGDACCTAIDDIIAGRTPGAAARQIYASLAAGPLTRNSDCILPTSVDISCWSTWNSFNGQNRAGIAITPRHIVCADHYPLPDGTTLHFQGADGSHHTRLTGPSLKVGESDIRVSLLNADLPGAVTPAQILPDDWPDYITTIEGLPHISSNRLREVKIAAGRDISLPPASSAVRWYSVSPADTPLITGNAARAAWYSQAVAGDIRNWDNLRLCDKLRREVIGPWMRVNGIGGRIPLLTHGGTDASQAELSAPLLSALPAAGLELTDEGIAELSERIGLPLRRSTAQIDRTVGDPPLESTLELAAHPLRPLPAYRRAELARAANDRLIDATAPRFARAIKAVDIPEDITGAGAEVFLEFLETSALQAQ